MRCRRKFQPEVFALRREYRESFALCQYTAAVGQYVQFEPHFSDRLELEHIWGRGKYGEHWSNYAMACPAAHVWKHKNLTVGRIAIMRYKFVLAKTTRDWRHFDVDAIQKVSGYLIDGWLANQAANDKLPAWARAMAFWLKNEMEAGVNHGIMGLDDTTSSES